jgi:hypothetical protein
MPQVQVDAEDCGFANGTYLAFSTSNLGRSFFSPESSQRDMIQVIPDPSSLYVQEQTDLVTSYYLPPTLLSSATNFGYSCCTRALTVILVMLFAFPTAVRAWQDVALLVIVPYSSIVSPLKH